MPAEDEDAVLICIKSNKQQSGQEWLNGKTVTKDTSCVEADVNATVYIQMVSENKQIVKLIANVDPMFDTFPQWLLNKAIEKIALLFLDQIGKKAENLSEQYKKLIE